MNSENRRDVATRKIAVFQNLAKKLVALQLTPNQVSIASSVFAFGSGISFYYAGNKILFLIFAIIGIQLRLICNLIDGLMAVEGGLKTKSGEVFNDVPDRFSDIFILLGAGYWCGLIDMGWTAAVLAVLTAYIRTLGASMTGQHDFAGPMAKQHRMFLVTLGAAGGIIEILINNSDRYVMKAVLAVIIAGCGWTCWNRLRRLYLKLEG